jgi:hypothetical protein
MTHGPDIVATPWGPMDRTEASYRVLRDMITIHESIVARNDAAESKLAEAIAKMDEARKLRNGALDLIHRLDAYIARQEQRKADEARAREFAEEPVVLPPDLQEYQTKNPPAEIGDTSPEVSKEPEPSLEIEGDNTGDLPEEIQLPKPLSEPVPEPSGSVFPQPISVSLNEG